MNKRILTATGVGLLVLGVTIFYTISQTPRTAYVDVVALYDGFRLKKELENKLTTFQTDTRYLLDSMQMEIKQVINVVNHNQEMEERLAKLQKETLLKQQQIEMDYQEMASHFDEQVWNQLNQYIKDFSDEEGYDFILGANGGGTVLAGNDAYNVTTDLINYANNRYHGMAK